MILLVIRTGVSSHLGVKSIAKSNGLSNSSMVIKVNVYENGWVSQVTAACSVLRCTCVRASDLKKKASN